MAKSFQGLWAGVSFFFGSTNWSGTRLPANGDNLTFAGSSRLTITGKVRNLSGHLQTINLPVTGGAAGKIWDGGTMGINLNGAFNLSSNRLTLTNKIAISNSTLEFIVGNSGTAALTLASGSSVSNTNGYVGLHAGGSGTITITVDGAGSTWANSGTLDVGRDGSGMLNIRNGGAVTNRLNGLIGISAGSIGIATVDGAGSTWTNSMDLAVGFLGSGTLNVQNGGAVEPASMAIGDKGRVNLKGGILSVGSSSLAGDALFNWTTGTLNYTGDASLGNGWIGMDSFLMLTTGKTLQVDKTLSVGADKALILVGGHVKTETLALDGSTVFAMEGINLSDAGNLCGHGTVAGAISGGAGKTITASGGTFTLGNASVNRGFSFNGHLKVGTSQVILLSKDKAQLGSNTTFGAGGSLVTANGAVLANGQELIFTGDASIQGGFTNDGLVSGWGGALTFLNDVSGAGAFAGNVVFKAGHQPGNSPATVDFNGGNVIYHANSVLTMEILGAAPGSEYDQLVGIDQLTFNGTLKLVFGNGYVPVAGSSFVLLGFNSFSGTLGTGNIDVIGFDRKLLDVSQLAQSGVLGIASVPEPESWALLLAGLGMVLCATRRRMVARTLDV